jgi:hypothetical protein
MVMANIVGQFVQSLPDNSLALPGEIFNGDSRILFGPDNLTDVSAVFAIVNKPYSIRAFNLTSGEYVTIEMVAGVGSGTMYAPAVHPDGSAIVLTPTRPSHILSVSGRYRARLTGRIGEVYVDAYPSDLLRTSKPTNNYGT